MKEHPILFSAEMVKAILDGRKTVTRRVIKEIPPYYIIGNKPQSYGPDDYNFYDLAFPIETYPTLVTPRYQVGDLLWVRETWWQGQGPTWGSNCIVYDADKAIGWTEGSHFDITDMRQFKKKPSIFMPKWATRIWREVVSVRAEQLQEITEDDAIAEGIRMYEYGTEYDKKYGGREKNMSYSVGFGTKRLSLGVMPNKAIVGFRRLWNSINAKPKPIYKTIKDKKQIIGYVSYPWENVQEEREYRGKVWHVIGNPWVWRVEFKKYPKKQR